MIKIGNRQEVKYLNNGRQTDLSIEERTKYLSELAKTDEVLRQAIERHEKEPSKETHLAVEKAMEERIAVDKKYDVKQKQREVTDETLENAKDIIEEDDHGKTKHDDDDDYGPWSRRH